MEILNLLSLVGAVLGLVPDYAISPIFRPAMVGVLVLLLTDSWLREVKGNGF